jgi:hypothetical protein
MFKAFSFYNRLLFITVGVCLIMFGLSGFREGFKAGMPGIRCGVDLPRCNSALQCLNGFCEGTQQPQLPRNQLPVFP